ncbi:MAG: hypothetical protein AVDCRST_MAG64-1725 [uncultured Phycisphaerae bacterium]|uniref:Uncharacterized protein n=1 Tax=uncultured Phycisphaerae bacterium TaxID=904963 RepID=A0A6J4NZ40_9BACT|nr:MAG: hypothetical protein AVDCRST_MAG64-1725 [uncultured Phycisphaerae bacterium]
MTDDPSWRQDALRAYRNAFLILAQFHDPLELRVEYLADELREALFDLKQAVMSDDESFAKRASGEAQFLAHELRRELEE